MRKALKACSFALGLALLTLVGSQSTALAQERGHPTVGAKGITETVGEIMAREWATYPGELGWAIRDMEGREMKPEKEENERFPRPNPKAPKVSQWPPRNQTAGGSMLSGLRGDQPYVTVGTNFLGGTISDTAGFVPPDTMGDVGPTQVLVCVNGLIRVFNRAGVMGSLNASTNSFFTSVRNGSTISDPRVKFDRLSNRWYVVCINTVTPNRVLLAVSSGPTIVDSTSFTFFQFQHDLVGTTPNADTNRFFDYPSLGIDNNALYIGGNVFGGSFSTTGFVIRKSSVTSGGPIVVTPFRQIGTGTATGVYAPIGVDNDDPSATQGYFVGVDTITFSLLVMRRVSDPGGTPTISANITLIVPTTNFPQATPCLGSVQPLDALDDRVFEAKLFHNKLTNTRTLWTAHNIEVDSTGVGSTAGNRNGGRWYQITNLSTTPSLVQSGTVFSNAATNPANYSIPSMAMNLQGHTMFGSTVCGGAERAEVGATQRFSSDGAGTMQAPAVVQTSATDYNAQSGGAQRWGDYSHTVVDPNDGMSVWTFQEYCSGPNQWGVRVVQLLAPPPAGLTLGGISQPNLVRNTTTNVTVTGTSASGSGFFDPGAGYPNHIAATMSGTGVTVNTVTFTDPTHVTLNLTISNTAATGARNLTITNPDGQATSLTGAFTVVNPVPTITSLVPNSATAGGSGFTLTVNGSNYVTESVINWGGTPLTTSFITTGQLTAPVTAAMIASPGTVNVSVTNPVPGGGTTGTLPFTINNPGPQVIPPDSYSVITGSETSHTLSDFLSSDDVRHTIQADPAQGFVSVTEFHAISPAQTVSRLSFIVESSTNFEDRRRAIQLFNFTNSTWEQLIIAPIPLTDGTLQVDVTTNPSRFINAGTKDIKARVACDFPTAARTLSRSFEFYDLCVWEIQQ